MARAIHAAAIAMRRSSQLRAASAAARRRIAEWSVKIIAALRDCEPVSAAEL
jgi:hypothetical protein